MSYTAPRYYTYHLNSQSDSVSKRIKQGSWIDTLLSKKVSGVMKLQQVSNALSQAKSNLSWSETNQALLSDKQLRIGKADLQWHRKFTSAVACLVMFLIGAPLGSIIKKGGFGLPVLVAILFFILMYVMTIQGDKLATEGKSWVPAAAWASNLVLLGFGLFFLKRAIEDSRLFDSDAYLVYFNRLRQKFTAWKERRAFLKKVGNNLA